MATIQQTSTATSCASEIAAPIVTLNRLVLVNGVALAVFVQQPLVTTALFVVVLGAVLFGQRGSLVYQVGSRLFAERNAAAIAEGRYEDRKLMRFNNAIAALMLGGAQVAFLAGAPVVGWGLSLAVATAAAVALAGFCLGCFLYTQYKLNPISRARGR